MPMFSGKNGEGIPVVGPIARGDVVGFMGRCVLNGWVRVAVGEGMHILAAYNGGRVWLHPQLRSDN